MRPLILTFILFMTVSGCTSTASIFDPPSSRGVEDAALTGERSPEHGGRKSEKKAELYQQLESALRTELQPWSGTPHLWGGNTKMGVDCSGLINQVYSDLLSFELPRTTGELIREGKSVRRSDLRAGDLVFFSPSGKKGSHVGIYLSDGEFTHASSSRGVMNSDLSNRYWDRVYETGRRVIENEDGLRKTLQRLQERQKLAERLQSE